jgi:hypothetical protein
MADPITLAAISVGSNVIGGISQKRAGDRAAAAANQAAEFNAQIIERDIGLLERQRNIINANFLIQSARDRTAFERDVQGGVRAGFGFAGIDVSQGSPMAVLRSNAREFEYEQAVSQFNNQIVNMQIADEQENSRLSAQLSRMEGGAQAASLRSQGTASLIRSIGQSAQTAYNFNLT